MNTLRIQGESFISRHSVLNSPTIHVGPRASKRKLHDKPSPLKRSREIIIDRKFTLYVK